MTPPWKFYPFFTDTWNFHSLFFFNTNIVQVFYKKSVDLDFIHDMEINRNTNFYLKVKKKPQMSKK